MDLAPKTLAQIAEASGFTMADVAFLAGLEESTVSRLWDSPDWLDRIKGRSLQSLIGVLPGVAEYVFRHSLRNRRAKLAGRLAEEGLRVDQEAFRRLVVHEKIPEQYLSNALEAAVHIMREDTRTSAAHLVRFWGRVRDFALGYLFAAEGGSGLLVDSGPLIEASFKIVQDLAGRSNSFHALVAHANLTHYLARTSNELDIDHLPSERQSALSYRSGIIGLIIQTNNFEVVHAYANAVKENRLLSLIEDWAMPTYANDARTSTDFSLPRSLLLRHTAAEVIREIESYNDAYLYYLVTIYLPIALRRDPTFGLRISDLKTALDQRMERCADSTTRRACDALQTRLKRHGQNDESRTLGHAW